MSVSANAAGSDSCDYRAVLNHTIDPGKVFDLTLPLARGISDYPNQGGTYDDILKFLSRG